MDPHALLGAWDFDRVVTDRLADEVISVIGLIDFTLTEGGDIKWSEQGTMTRAGAKIAVTRVLFLRAGAQGWSVIFEDGRDFHPWRPGVEVEHLCGRDTYRGFVEFADDVAAGERTGEWSVTWHVTGPAKNYEMVTRLTQRRGGSGKKPLVDAT